MNIHERIFSASELGKRLLQPSDNLLNEFNNASQANVWFTPKCIESSIKNISTEYLDLSKISYWVSQYSFERSGSKSVGIIAAGNIPLVVFHDVLACFIAGHKVKIKLSQKDEILFTAILKEWISIDSRVEPYFEIVERIKDIDAIIATGSDNSARYFHYYFDKYPHIIRKNRVSMGIITGTETDQELMELGRDVFEYFGLGCRNISSLRISRDFDLVRLLRLWEEFKWVRDNHAYNNNFDYNTTLYIMNNVPYLSNDNILLTENESLVSRLATLYFQYFENLEDVIKEINIKKDQLQVIVSNKPITGINTVLPGQAQCPSLFDYADNIDTMKFLTTL